MTSWSIRKAIGDALEKRVAYEFKVRGWRIAPIGQGTLPTEMSDALRRTDNSLRWLPDLIAIKNGLAVLIDCKASMTSRASRRHAVERAAVRAHLLMAASFDMPLYYVFDDLGVLTPMDVKGLSKSGPHSSVGSGAPYYLISAAHGRSLDDVFGPISNERAA